MSADEGADQPERTDKPGTDKQATDKAEGTEDTRPSRMTARERQIGFVLAAIGAVVAVAVAANGNPLIGALSGVAAIGLGVSSRFGHRIVTAFVAILGGFFLALPANFAFLGYGGYLMFRSSRAQAKLNASRPRLTPEQRREAREARRAAKRGEATPTLKRPTPSGRYTPPKAKAKPGRQQ